MGRSGRVAPRICSTLEIRTHPPSSSMALTLPPPPSSTTTVIAAAAPAPAPLTKTTTVSCSPLPPPLSPDTPGQTLPPASVKPRQQQQAWPLALLQLMQQQLEMLNSRNDDDGGITSAAAGCTKRKRCCAAAADHHDQEGPLQDPYEAGAVAAGNDMELDVELHAQSPLPDEWEQFLDLRVRDARLPISNYCCCF
jgi:hypothetical protein